MINAAKEMEEDDEMIVVLSGAVLKNVRGIIEEAEKQKERMKEEFQLGVFKRTQEFVEKGTDDIDDVCFLIVCLAMTAAKKYGSDADDVLLKAKRYYDEAEEEYQKEEAHDKAD